MVDECYECDGPLSGKNMRYSDMGNIIYLCDYCDRITPAYMGESQPGVSRNRLKVEGGNNGYNY